MVDWDGLENRCAGNRTVGSNPTLSAMAGAPQRGSAWFSATITPGHPAAISSKVAVSRAALAFPGPLPTNADISEAERLDVLAAVNVAQIGEESVRH